jgi:hypothetical protein
MKLKVHYGVKGNTVISILFMYQMFDIHRLLTSYMTAFNEQPVTYYKQTCLSFVAKAHQYIFSIARGIL